jgi:hypothetical protein
VTNYFTIAALAAALLLAGALDVHDQLEAERDYCAMVKTWENTQGKYGWPPYRGKCE